VLGIFEIGSCELFAWDWPRTTILLIAASWVARITGVSHQHPACFLYSWCSSICSLGRDCLSQS
jgi:hypothetical protein